MHMPLAIAQPASTATLLQQSRTHHSRVCVAHERGAVDVPAGCSTEQPWHGLAQEHADSLAHHLQQNALWHSWQRLHAVGRISLSWTGSDVVSRVLSTQ